MRVLRANGGLAAVELEQDDCTRLAQALYAAALACEGSEPTADLFGLDGKPANDPHVRTIRLYFEGLASAFDALAQAATCDGLSDAPFITTGWRLVPGAICVMNTEDDAAPQRQTPAAAS